MHILYVTNNFPFPLTRGYLRHYHLIRALCQEHRITLVSLVDGNFRAEYVDALAPYTERVLAVPAFRRPRSLANKVLRQLQVLVDVAPWAPALRATLEEVRQKARVDVALVCGRETDPAMDALVGIPVVRDICDAASVRISGRMPYARPLRRAWLHVEHRRMREMERRLVERADHALFASRRDLDAVVDSFHDASVVPNGVDLDYWQRSTKDCDPQTILLTGAMDYRPNTDAALFLAEEIFPKLRARWPEAQLILAGRDAPPELVRVGAHPGISVTGFVEDMRPYLERATVFAAPLRFGAGIQNKLLEALAMGVPVVTSSLAGNGIRTDLGGAPPVCVADDPDAFAEQLSRCLDASPERDRVVCEGRAYVREHFSWEGSAARLAAVLEAVVAGRSAC